MNLAKLKPLLYLFVAINLLTPVIAQTSAISVVSVTLCKIVSFVRAIIGILALVLFLIGGVLYAVGHFLPASGNIRSNIQGWAIGMLFAAIVSLVIYVIAQPIILLLTGLGSTFGASSVTINCP